MALTGGSVDQNVEGIHVKKSDVKDKVVVSEQWSPPMNDTDAFHHLCDREDDIHGKEEEGFVSRTIAMKRAVGDVMIARKKFGVIASVHTHLIPIKTDPCSVKAKPLATGNGMPVHPHRHDRT